MTKRPFEYPIEPKLHEIDPAGVMFFAHLFRHMHDAYEAFMDAAGLPLPDILARADYRLPVVHAEADYLAPIRQGERLGIRLHPGEPGEHSFRIDYAFVDPAGAERARAHSVHACIDAASGASRSLPEAVRAVLTSSA